MLIYSLFRSAREGPADKQACTLFSQQKGGGAGWENLVNPSPEPGLYKGTYPSVLRVPFGEGVKKAGAREAKEITSACVFIFLAAVAFIHTTPAATSSTSPTPNRGREASQGSRGRNHGASLRLRKRRRLTFYPLPILLHFCMHTHVHWRSLGRHPSMSPKKCCTST